MPPHSPSRAAAFARATRRPAAQRSIAPPPHVKHSSEAALRKVSFKNYELEEWADLFVHRPLAHRLIQLILALRLPGLGLTPNHVTLCSLLAGWGAAAWMAEALIGGVLPAWHVAATVGNSRVAVHVLAATLMLLSISLDCADGQLARALGVSSPMGRFYDGLSDTLVIASYCAVWCVAVLRLSGGSLVWYVAACAMCISLQQHFVLFDKVKIVYTLQTRPPSDRSKRNLTACCDAADLARRAAAASAAGERGQAFAYRCAVAYAKSLAIDVGNPMYQNRTLTDATRAEITRTMRLLSFLGTGTHLLLWYVCIAACGVAPWCWKAFLLFQLTAVNAFDAYTRSRCVALKLHAGSYSEWTSSLPFVALGVLLPFIFGRYAQ